MASRGTTGRRAAARGRAPPSRPAARRGGRARRTRSRAAVLLLGQVLQLLGERLLDLRLGGRAARAASAPAARPTDGRARPCQRAAGERLGGGAQRGPVAGASASALLAVAEAQPRARLRGRPVDPRCVRSFCASAPGGSGSKRTGWQRLAIVGRTCVEAVREQQQDDVRRRLLERLEQRVGRLVVHACPRARARTRGTRPRTACARQRPRPPRRRRGAASRARRSARPRSGRDARRARRARLAFSGSRAPRASSSPANARAASRLPEPAGPCSRYACAGSSRKAEPRTARAWGWASSSSAIAARVRLVPCPGVGDHLARASAPAASRAPRAPARWRPPARGGSPARRPLLAHLELAPGDGARGVDHVAHGVAGARAEVEDVVPAGLTAFSSASTCAVARSSTWM